VEVLIAQIYLVGSYLCLVVVGRLRARWVGVIGIVIVLFGAVSFIVGYDYVYPLRCCEGQYTMYLGAESLFSKNNTLVFGAYNPEGANEAEVGSVLVNDSPCVSSSWIPVQGNGTMVKESCVLSFQAVSGRTYDLQVNFSFSNGIISDGVSISGTVTAI
jgi:hypothetical protein